MAEASSAGYVRTGSAEGASTSMASSRRGGSTARSPEVAAESMSEPQYIRWKMELQNKMIVDEQKRQEDERRKFKEREDARFWKRKQELHRRTSEEFGNAKHVVEELTSRNHKQAEEYKRQLALMKTARQSQRDEWTSFGHERVEKYGQAQIDRLKEAEVACVEAKRGKGLAVRREEKRLERQLASQRAEMLEEARQHVTKLKEEKIGKTEESMSFALRNRQAAVDQVKRTEAKWRATAKQEKEEHLQRAHQNARSAKNTNDSMRSSRETLTSSHNRAVREERQRKEKDAQLIAQRRAEHDDYKKKVHDSVFAQRRLSPDKQRQVTEVSRAPSTKKAAKKAGLIAPTGRSPSPYKLS